MGNSFRYRSGVVQFVLLPTSTDYPIEEGDLLVLHGGVAKPVSELADAGTAAQNRVASAAIFVGVACMKVGLQTGETGFKLTNDPGYILIATTGDFEYPCASTSWVTGELAGIYNDATDNSDQTICRVTDPTEAIAVAKVPLDALGQATTAMVISLRSAIMNDAINTSGS